MNMHLARLKARQDEAKFIRSPEEAKARIAELQREIDEEEKRIDAENERPTPQVTYKVVLPPNCKIRYIDVPGGIV